MTAGTGHGSRGPWPAVLAWLCYGLVAVLGWAGLPAGGFWINDEGVKYLQMLSINADPERSSALRLEYRPEDTDGLLPQTPAYLLRTTDGYRFFFPDHFARSAALAERLGGATAARLLPLAAGLVAVAAWTATAWWCRARAAAWVPLVVLASPWMFYHWTFWEHTSALLCQTVSLLVSLGAWRARRPAGLALGGLVLGLGAFYRIEIALYAAAFTLALALVYREWRRPLAFAVGVAPPVLALLAFNAWFRTHPLGLAYHAQLSHQDARWKTAWTLLVGLSSSPWLGWIALVGVGAVLMLSGSRRPAVALAGLAGGLGAAAVLRVAFLARRDPFHALVDFGGAVTLPPILLAGLAVGFAGRGRPGRRALAATTGLYIGAATLFCPSVSAAGIHWGPRMLFPALVPAALLAAERLALGVRAARRWPRWRWATGALIGALALGWADTVYAWHLLHGQRAHTVAVERFLQARSERFIATDLWWVPQVYARATATHVFFLVSTPADEERFRAFIRRHGEPDWLLATDRRRVVGVSAEPLDVPGAPDRGTVLDARLYREHMEAPSP